MEYRDHRGASLRRREVGAALLAYLAGQALVWAIVGIVAGIRAEKAAGQAGFLREVTGMIPIALPASLLASGIALLLVLRRWRRRFGSIAVSRMLGLSWGPRHQLLRGIASGAALAIVALPLVALMSHKPETPDLTTQLAMSSNSAMIAWILSAVLLAPPIEELMFRGVFLGGLAQTWSLGAAALVSGITFWLMHGPEFVHWQAALSIGMLTLLATYFRLRTRILGPSVAAHFGYNLIIAGMVALAMIARPGQSKWAGLCDPAGSSSACAQGEQRQLGRAAEPGRYAGGSHSSRDVQGSEGVAIPSLEEAAGADRLDRRQEGNTNLASVGVTGQQQSRPGGNSFGGVLREDGRMDQPDFSRSARQLSSRGDNVGTPGGRIIQSYQAQPRPAHIDGLGPIHQEVDAGGAVGLVTRAPLDLGSIFPVTE
jgi:membrane protease YdiL (CAAX protease family)